MQRATLIDLFDCKQFESGVVKRRWYCQYSQIQNGLKQLTLIAIHFICNIFQHENMFDFLKHVTFVVKLAFSFLLCLVALAYFHCYPTYMKLCMWIHFSSRHFPVPMFGRRYVCMCVYAKTKEIAWTEKKPHNCHNFITQSKASSFSILWLWKNNLNCLWHTKMRKRSREDNRRKLCNNCDIFSS